MARRICSSQLESRTARLKLPVRWKPYAVRVAPGVRLAYRRNEAAGSWSVIAADGKGGSWMKGFAIADDHESANSDTVLDFWQAQDRARVLARGSNAPEDNTRPVTVAAALDNYEADLRTRGGDVGNVGRVRVHLTDALAEKAVALLTPRELRRWRDALKKTLAASSINRVANAFRAALNLAANTDEHVVSRRAWEVGLQAIPDATVADNVILPVGPIRQIVANSYEISEAFGLLIEIAATTGARVSQSGTPEVQDVQGDRADPRLMMPSSRKGRGQKKITRRPVPIPHDLAVRLTASRETPPGHRSAPDKAEWRAVEEI